MSMLQETFTLANGNAIPRIGFGTWLLAEGDECVNACRTALEIGYRHIDTALAYHNEASVGQAVRESGIPREDIFVTSKLPAEAKTEEQARADFDTTMREIGLDHLDLYLVHAPWPWEEMGADYSSQNREIWKLMEEFLASGKVRAIGVCNFSPTDLDNLATVATTLPMVNQIRYFIGAPQDETVAWCDAHDVVVEAFSPFAHGLIVNHPEIMAIAETYGVSAPQLSIRYLLQKNALPLPKATNPEHIRQNAEVDFVISAADMAVLDAMRDTEKHPDAMEFRWS